MKTEIISKFDDELSRHTRTADVLAELYKAFDLFNKDYFNNTLEIPAIIIESRGKRKYTLGWCSSSRTWRDESTGEYRFELNIVSEALHRGLEKVMTTLLHEMVHLYCGQNDIKETSRNCIYHNTRFKEEAEKRGLTLEYDKEIGWSYSELNEDAKEKLKSYDLSEEVFALHKRDFEEEIRIINARPNGPIIIGEDTQAILDDGLTVEIPKKKKQARKYICNCLQPKIFRATKELDGIFCVECNSFFKEET